MKERPILFSASMIQALLKGEKSQTRRVMKPQPHPNFLARGLVEVVPQWPHQDGVRWFMADGCSELIKCPYGKLGDRLWVRETFATGYGQIHYRASNDLADCGMVVPWKPSIHMPRRTSRITLEIVGIRVEQVQQISESDAKAEGIGREKKYGKTWYGFYPVDEDFPGSTTVARDSFASLWNSINAKRGFGWEQNPWVWVIKFKLVRREMP